MQVLNRVEVADDKGPIVVGAGQVALAEKLVAPVGTMDGSFAHHFLVGAVAYILSKDEYKHGNDKGITVAKIKAALKSNRILLDKALNSLTEDLTQE